MKRFEMKVPEEDLTSWKEAAESAGKPLAEWVRGKCNERVTAVAKESSGEGDRVPTVRGDAEIPAPKRRKSEAVEPVVGGCSHDFGYAVGKCPYGTCANRNPKAVARCEHLTEKGYRCGFCGGLAEC